MGLRMRCWHLSSQIGETCIRLALKSRLSLKVGLTSQKPAIRMQSLIETFFNIEKRELDAGLAAGLTLALLVAIWLPHSIFGKLFLGVVLILSAARCWRLFGEGGIWSFGDFRSSGWVRAVLSVSVLTFVLSIFLFLFASTSGVYLGNKTTDMWDKSFMHWVTVKLPTVGLQQFLLQWLLLPMLLNATRRPGWAVGITAVVFSLMHLPNPVLMGLTLIAGVFWVSSFLQHRKLTPLIASHFVLAILAAGVCGEYVFSMRVGPTCLEIFPIAHKTTSGKKYEFPGCMMGSVERLSQKNNTLRLEGWLTDCVHDQEPRSFWLSVDGRMTQLSSGSFKKVRADRWETAVRSGYTSEHCFQFTVHVNRDLLNDSEQVELYAENCNGHLSQMGRMGELIAMVQPPSDYRVVLFPVEVDGRLHGISVRNGRPWLSGWVANLKRAKLPNRIAYLLDGKLREVNIQGRRKQQLEIARNLEKPVFENCGFECSVANVPIYLLDRVRFFAVDEERALHPLDLTAQVETRVAEIVERTNNPNVILR